MAAIRTNSTPLSLAVNYDSLSSSCKKSLLATKVSAFSDREENSKWIVKIDLINLLIFSSV